VRGLLWTTPHRVIPAWRSGSRSGAASAQSDAPAGSPSAVTFEPCSYKVPDWCLRSTAAVATRDGARIPIPVRADR
jgi:hypothetical protein